MSINDYVIQQQNALRRLSRSEQARLRREALRLCERTPHMADASTYWRGLSARQVIAAAATR